MLKTKELMMFGLAGIRDVLGDEVVQVVNDFELVPRSMYTFYLHTQHQIVIEKLIIHKLNLLYSSRTDRVMRDNCLLYIQFFSILPPCSAVV